MKTIVLTFDDAVRSQLTIVAPVLKRFGFGATFFVCRFSDEWRAQHSEHLMGLEELRELQRQGFEIGNHTWSHPNMRELSDAENAREVDSLSEWLKSLPPNTGILAANDAVSACVIACCRRLRIQITKNIIFTHSRCHKTHCANSDNSCS